MRSQLVLAVTLGLGLGLSSTPAHAMGTYINLELFAWSDDGTTAIVKRITTSSGTVGVAVDYILVGTRDEPIVTSFHSTLDPETPNEQIDIAACTKAADKLAQLAAHRRFTGLVVHRDRCKTAARAVLTVTPAQQKVVAASNVPISEGDGDTMASATGALRLRFTGENGDSSRPARCEVMMPTSTGFVVRYELRSAGRPD